MTNPGELVRGAMLERVQASPIRAEWSTNSYEPAVSLWLPHNCKFGGTLWSPSEDKRNFSFDPLSVSSLLRRNGIATRLVHALTHVALTIPTQFETYGGSVSSPHMAELLGRVFSAERLTYESGDFEDTEELAPDEAMYDLRQGRDVLVAINLQGLAAQDFEAPVFLQGGNLPPVNQIIPNNTQS